MEVYWLVCGVRSSALHFNRLSLLTAAVARRFGVAITGPCVDHFTTIDLVGASGSARDFKGRVLSMMGGALGPDQQSPPGRSMWH